MQVYTLRKKYIKNREAEARKKNLRECSSKEKKKTSSNTSYMSFYLFVFFSLLPTYAHQRLNSSRHASNNNTNNNLEHSNKEKTAKGEAMERFVEAERVHSTGAIYNYRKKKNNDRKAVQRRKKERSSAIVQSTCTHLCLSLHSHQMNLFKVFFFFVREGVCFLLLHALPHRKQRDSKNNNNYSKKEKVMYLRTWRVFTYSSWGEPFPVLNFQK